MVADLFDSTLKADWKEQVTSNRAALHASKCLRLPSNREAFAHSIFTQQHVLQLR